MADLKYKIILSTALVSVAVFILLYNPFLYGNHPGAGSWFIFHYLAENIGGIGLYIVLMLVFINFTFLLYFKGHANWKTKGIYSAFIISLFTEMFGFALIVYFTSPVFSYPVLMESYRSNPYRWLKVFSSFLIVIGLFLITLGWRTLYLSKGLSTGGIYRYMRHPQYVGFIMVILGWLGIWPTLITILIFPVYLLIFLIQARRETTYLIQKYGAKFLSYKSKVRW